jgi:trk system potassium uptake protein TrkH
MTIALSKYKRNRPLCTRKASERSVPMILFGKMQFSLQRIIALGFALIILTGGLLLTLPAASKDGNSLGFVDALFTATSATCVTGLVVKDTYTQFTLLGQIIILVLIQIGGLGFISMTIFFLMAAGRKVNLKERSLLMEANNTFHIGGAVKFVKRVLIGTVIFELTGAILLALRFIPLFGTARGAWFGVFHSISAFCNAGFDLLGEKIPYVSLTEYRADPLVVLVIASLIACGGLGFIVWDDLARQRFHIKRCNMHTKLVLTVTAALIAGGTTLFLILENQHTLAGMPFGEKLLSALFQSVTPRTAGYNTIDQASLSEGGSLLTMLLMFIGASPGSTGGGIKTSTFTVIFLAAIAYVRSRHDINIFGRRLEDGIVSRAFCSVAIYLSILVAGVMVVFLNQNLPFEDVFFEAFSAIGTVGLSTGITRELTVVSRIAMILLMYSGRVGSLTLAMALSVGKQPAATRNPQGKIAIG